MFCQNFLLQVVNTGTQLCLSSHSYHMVLYEILERSHDNDLTFFFSFAIAEEPKRKSFSNVWTHMDSFLPHIRLNVPERSFRFSYDLLMVRKCFQLSCWLKQLNNIFITGLGSIYQQIGGLETSSTSCGLQPWLGKPRYYMKMSFRRHSLLKSKWFLHRISKCYAIPGWVRPDVSTSGCAQSGCDPKPVIRGKQSVLNSVQKQAELISSVWVYVTNGVGACMHLKMNFEKWKMLMLPTKTYCI